jgi:hypothetical protein
VIGTAQSSPKVGWGARAKNVVIVEYWRDLVSVVGKSFDQLVDPRLHFSDLFLAGGVAQEAVIRKLVERYHWAAPSLGHTYQTRSWLP